MERNLKSLEELEFKDDFMFGAVLNNLEICKEVLETVLNVRIKSIKVPELQKTLDIAYESKGIRMDVYVEDEAGTIYDVEMQKADRGNLPKRSRYYQAILDLSQLGRGKHYSNLPRSILIFFCDFDPFEEGLYRYTFENLCREQPGKKLGDETTKIYLNAAGRGGAISPELKRLLNYIRRPGETERGTLTEKIDEEIKQVKINGERRQEFMLYQLKLEEAMMDAREEGLQAGREEGLQAGREEGLQAGREEGLQVGREEGLQVGREEGLQKGREAGLQAGRQEGMEGKAIEDARKLKEKGVSEEIIAEAIGLPRETVKNL